MILLFIRKLKLHIQNNPYFDTYNNIIIFTNKTKIIIDLIILKIIIIAQNTIF